MCALYLFRDHCGAPLSFREATSQYCLSSSFARSFDPAAQRNSLHHHQCRMNPASAALSEDLNSKEHKVHAALSVRLLAVDELRILSERQS